MKQALIIMIMVASLIVAGCDNTQGGTSVPIRPWIGGTQGVDMHFELEAPPNQVIAGDPFIVMVILQNKGEHDIEQGDYFVQLKGINPAIFGTNNNQLRVYPSEDLPGKELESGTGNEIPGYPVYVQIPAQGELAYNPQAGLSGNMQLPFHAELCYTYKTHADAKLCIKEDLTKVSDTKVCTIQSPQTITSSAAPVQITDFKEFGGGRDAVRFSFNVVAAQAGGDLSERSSSCATDTIKKDRVFVTVNSGLSGLSCTGFLGDDSTDTQGYVKLTGGSRQITCTQRVSEADRADFVQVVQISAEYDYSIGIQKNVIIQPMVE